MAFIERINMQLCITIKIWLPTSTHFSKMITNVCNFNFTLELSFDHSQSCYFLGKDDINASMVRVM